jgi:hypothetical protein
MAAERGGQEAGALRRSAASHFASAPARPLIHGYYVLNAATTRNNGLTTTSVGIVAAQFFDIGGIYG